MRRRASDLGFACAPSRYVPEATSSVSRQQIVRIKRTQHVVPRESDLEQMLACHATCRRSCTRLERCDCTVEEVQVIGPIELP